MAKTAGNLIDRQGSAPSDANRERLPARWMIRCAGVIRVSRVASPDRNQSTESRMTRRWNILAGKNDGIDGLVAVEAWFAKSFDPKLMELVKVPVSQINGCTHCLHMIVTA